MRRPVNRYTFDRDGNPTILAIIRNALLHCHCPKYPSVSWPFISRHPPTGNRISSSTTSLNKLPPMPARAKRLVDAVTLNLKTKQPHY